MDNADEDEDIELFIVTRHNTLWMTRLLVTVLADIYGIRRRPEDVSVKNKVCLNMFMDEGTMALPVQERDLFSAHEVVQLVSLWDSGSTYRRFLAANSWVRRYLFTAWKKRRDAATKKERPVSPGEIVMLGICRIGEMLVRPMQLLYMQRRRTEEIVEGGMLRFHPRDARIRVKRQYAKRLKTYDIPLDNIFYHR